MIEFAHDICGDIEAASRREWLETNGLGGFGSSTITGLNTRRYHGLLVAATDPPVGRLVMLSKLEETLFIDGQGFDLSANRYPGVVHPQGFRYLKRFRLDPFPVFTYEVAGIEIEKTVFMIYGENSTVVSYEAATHKSTELPKNLWLELRPLIAFRDYHSTTHQNGALNPELMEEPGLTAIAPYEGLPTLYLAHNAIESKKTVGIDILAKISSIASVMAAPLTSLPVCSRARYCSFAYYALASSGMGLVRKADLGQKLCKSRVRPKTVELRINANHGHIP